MLSDEVTEALIGFALAARAEFLSNGAKALSHWDQLQTRMLVAAQGTRDVRSFVTRFAKGLRLGAPKADRALATEALHKLVGTESAWLREIPREIAFIMAATRLRADERREARKQKADGQIDLFGEKAW